MNRDNFTNSLRRHEAYVMSITIALVFAMAMGVVAWMLRNSAGMPSYEPVPETALEKLYVTAYLRHREDDGSPYLKVEVHNATLWWIKKIEFTFQGIRYTLGDGNAFQPLHFGSLRCNLIEEPPRPFRIDYDLNIDRAYGYPPAQVLSLKSPASLGDGNVANEFSRAQE
jgi:hypothetical protein